MEFNAGGNEDGGLFGNGNGFGFVLDVDIGLVKDSGEMGVGEDAIVLVLAVKDEDKRKICRRMGVAISY